MNLYGLTKMKEKSNNFKYSVFVGTPCHSDVSIHYTQSVLELQKYCWNNKINLMFQLFKSSLVTQGRNLCVSAFYKLNVHIYYLLIQTLHLKPHSLQHLLDADKDVISVPYPLKDMCWDKGIEVIEKGRIKTAEDLKDKSLLQVSNACA